MSRFPLIPEDTLTVSVDGGAWQTLTFKAADFKKKGEINAAQIAKVINKSGIISARVNEAGALILETPDAGGHATLEFDWDRSSAAAALGLLRREGAARGRGLCAAIVTGEAQGPFQFEDDAALHVRVNDQAVVLNIGKGRYNAAKLAAELDEQTADVHVTATAAGTLQIRNESVGPDARLQITGDDAQAEACAAQLGFATSASAAQPHVREPARVACPGARAKPVLTNLTSAAIELHLAGGTMLVPVGGRHEVSLPDAASPPVQALVAAGKLGISNIT